jgi:hypothetical protein
MPAMEGCTVRLLWILASPFSPVTWKEEMMGCALHCNGFGLSWFGAPRLPSLGPSSFELAPMEVEAWRTHDENSWETKKPHDKSSNGS